MTLRGKIIQEIREQGPIPFSRYMEVCLYDPELGYYSRTVERFGKAGDFYTSSDVHAVFGRLLARQFEEMWRLLGSPNQIEILELGPGRGLFAQDVLAWSKKKFPAFFAALHYSLAEHSPALQERLRLTLSTYITDGKCSLVAADPSTRSAAERRQSTAEQRQNADKSAATRRETAAESAAERHQNAAHGASRGLGESEFQAPEGRKRLPPENIEPSMPRALAPRLPLIIFANEFFDAQPVEVLSSVGALRISQDNGRFVETWAPPSSDELEFLDRYAIHPTDHERIEAPLIAQRKMARASASIQRGFMIVIDYGYTRQELLAGRHRGTVTSYRQHSISASPYEAPGDQDITAHVNFTALATAAEHAGLQVKPLVTQSQFLLGIGEQTQFADAFEECRLPQEHAKVALQLKHLVTPAGVGETFHVLVASKGVELQPSALAGLSFGSNRDIGNAP